MHRSRPNVYSSCIALASLFVVVGCTVETAELIDVRFEKSYADVDVDCTGGCAGSDRLELYIALEDSAQLPTDAVVELTSYRVDFDVGAPSFEQPASVVLYRGAASAFGPAVAGLEQRNWGRAQAAEVSGLGTITIMGTDHQSKAVELTGQFNVRFADFAVTTTSSGAGGGGTGGSGAGGN